MREYKLEGHGVRGAVLGVVIVGIGVLVVASALTLLIILGAAATIIGAGVILYRRLTGRRAPGVPEGFRRRGLDPSMEVFAPDIEVRPIDTEPSRKLPSGRVDREGR
jgi:hypothetical protein